MQHELRGFSLPRWEGRFGRYMHLGDTCGPYFRHLDTSVEYPTSILYGVHIIYNGILTHLRAGTLLGLA